MRAVGIQKCAGNINDLFASPFQHQSRRFCNFRYTHGLQIFLRRVFHKLIHVSRVHDYCHTLLRLGNSDLCTVKARIFFRHLIQIDYQPVCQLANSHRYAARAEIVAFADQTRYFRAAEQSLDLTLRRSVSFLHFSAAGFDGSFCVYLGGAGGAAAAVSSRASAQQNDNVARIGSLTDHVFSRSGSHDCSDLHTFRHIIRMINLFYITAVTARRPAHQFFLRQFALQSLGYRHGGIRSSGYTHCLIDISTSG